MSAKKRAEELKSKTAINEMRGFVAADRFEDPEQILERFGAEVMAYCRRLVKHREYFHDRKINPFQRLQIICREKCLKFQDDFDKVAGMKA